MPDRTGSPIGSAIAVPKDIRDIYAGGQPVDEGTWNRFAKAVTKIFANETAALAMSVAHLVSGAIVVNAVWVGGQQNGMQAIGVTARLVVDGTSVPGGVTAITSIQQFNSYMQSDAAIANFIYHEAIHANGNGNECYAYRTADAASAFDALSRSGVICP